MNPDTIYYRHYYIEHREEIKARVKQYAREHQEENRLRAREWYRRNKQRVIARSREFEKNHKDRKPHYKRKLRYNLSRAEFELILRKQEYKCRVCCQDFGVRGPQVDHDHATGVVRGLLCVSCNGMLGMAKDNPETLLKATDYLLGTFYFHAKLD